MKKLTFERACLAVFILIILISTSGITSKYIEKLWKSYYKRPVESNEHGNTFGLATTFINADNLFREGDYQKAAELYLAMTLNNTLSIEQKAQAYFQLGLCHYYMGNYDRATESFEKVTNFSPNDSVAYNNAAVSAFKAKNMDKAIELQKKALEKMSVVEYYYNLARMYEDNEEYEQAASNFLVVVEAEHNITQVEHIDPVRVKEKVARLGIKNSASINETANNALRAYKIKDNRIILTIDEKEMQLKQNEFLVKVENRSNTKNIVAEYDRKKNDPYNLISEMIWIVYKDGKEIYRKISDKISINANDAGNYEIKLNIRYNGNNQMVAKKTVKVEENKSTIDTGQSGNISIGKNNKPSRTYEYAVYEQLFDKDFNLVNIGYVDKYNVVWGRDNVSIQLSKNEANKSESLLIRNDSTDSEGIWINLDSLIKQSNLYGKRVNIRFYARKITDNVTLNVKARAKTDVIILTQRSFELDYKWKEYNMYVTIPKDATGMTISIKTEPGQEYKLDNFLLVD